MKIAIVGYGKMGRAIRDLATSRKHEVVAELDVGQLEQKSLRGADVAIEFTQPDAAVDNLVRLAGWKVPVVCGTTGWYEQLSGVRSAFEKAGTGLVYAPNFSIGVQVLLRVAREVASAVKEHPEYDVQVIDYHHRAKKDAPSGTAGALRAALKSADPGREYPITSIRVGHVPGTHEVLVEGPGESLSFRHEARDRTIFAAGALTAAQWLLDRPRRGAFTLEQVLFGASS